MNLVVYALRLPIQARTVLWLMKAFGVFRRAYQGVNRYSRLELDYGEN